MPAFRTRRPIGASPRLPVCHASASCLPTQASRLTPPPASPGETWVPEARGGEIAALTRRPRRPRRPRAARRQRSASNRPPQGCRHPAARTHVRLRGGERSAALTTQATRADVRTLVATPPPALPCLAFVSEQACARSEPLPGRRTYGGGAWEGDTCEKRLAQWAISPLTLCGGRV